MSRANNAARESNSKHDLRASSVHSEDEKEVGERNGSRGRNRLAMEMYLLFAWMLVYMLVYAPLLLSVFFHSLNDLNVLLGRRVASMYYYVISLCLSIN